MVEVTKSAVTGTARDETERALNELERRADSARTELGRAVFKVADEYFPETARARRREDMAVGFLVGLVAGLAVGLLATVTGRR